MCGGNGKKNCSGGGGRKCSSICNGGNNGAAYNTSKMTTPPTFLPKDSVINLDHGDPKIFRPYWEKRSDECAITFSGSDLVSYFSVDPTTNICWFLEPDLNDAIRRLHRVTGNAMADKDDTFIVVGTGSSQLYQAALFALSTTTTTSIDDDDHLPVNVVSSAPYYSSYPDLTSYLKSGLYKWAGDANKFTVKEDEPAYIEVVCYPNNPDGEIRKPAAKARRTDQAKLIHDLAYYWPQYTPITTAADHDLMLFTFSKCTGHAGSRIGWAIVKDEQIARKMTKFIELNTIGTSKESQLRAARIMNLICDDYLINEDFSFTSHFPGEHEHPFFFEQGQSLLANRWERLREVLKLPNHGFSVPDYPKKYCMFMGKFTRTYPAFAWLECNKAEGEVDGAAVMRENKILARSGRRFGVDERFVRISMLDNDHSFDLFLERLSVL